MYVKQVVVAEEMVLRNSGVHQVFDVLEKVCWFIMR